MAAMYIAVAEYILIDFLLFSIRLCLHQVTTLLFKEQ